MHKPKGKKMEGLGRHHSTTEDKRIPGHSMVQSLYVLLGRRCPLAPQLYRQQTVCQSEGVPFGSLINLMEARIRSFEPVAGTVTHVLLDTRVSAPNATGLRHGSAGSSSRVASKATAGCGEKTPLPPKAGGGRSSPTIRRS